MNPAAMQRLKFLYPGWFAVVMGLAGLALAWHRAQPLMGETAGAVALVVGALAALVFAALAAASLLRAQACPGAWAEDRRHAVRHAFIAAIPVSLLLLATVATALGGRGWAVHTLWGLGALAQLALTWWVLTRWWAGGAPGGLPWAAVTPALFIPVVGNVVAPLAGVPLGHVAWSAAQFGIGVLFWPVVLGLLVVRLVQHGPWPERLRPTAFIVAAPPAVVGLALLQFGAPDLLAWALWGVALFSLAWAGQQAARIVALPFGLPHWGLSFPLAACAALTLRLATPGTPVAVLGVLLLALASLVVCALALATVRGLRDGSLLAPEPVAAVVAASA